MDDKRSIHFDDPQSQVREYCTWKYTVRVPQYTSTKVYEYGTEVMSMNHGHVKSGRAKLDVFPRSLVPPLLYSAIA